MVAVRDSKNFYFYFDWSKTVDENLTHEIEFIMKSNGSLAENEIENKTEQLLSKYKHGNDTYENEKQQKKLTT